MGNTSPRPGHPVPGKGLQVYGWSGEAAAGADPNTTSPTTQDLYSDQPDHHQTKAEKSKAVRVVGLWLKSDSPPVSKVTEQILSSGCHRQESSSSFTMTF